MINFIKRKIAKHKLMTTRQEFGYELKSYQLEGYGEIKYAHWLNPFSYNMVVSNETLDFYKKFISQGDFVIDIGANIGDTGLPMGLAAGSKGTVLALEPNPYTFKILEVNTGLNKDKINIIPLPYAATEEDGEFFYSASEASFNNGGVSKTQSKLHSKYELETKIKGINLEKLLRNDYEHLLNSLSCIKVDTEGYDKDIILSLDGIIKEFKPSIIFEIFQKLGKSDRFELFDFLHANGYSMFKFEEFSLNVPVKKIIRDDMSRWRWMNVYALYE
jgi:FkbM family methyltransferase